MWIQIYKQTKHIYINIYRSRKAYTPLTWATPRMLQYSFETLVQVLQLQEEKAKEDLYDLFALQPVLNR